jgi:hypothetical protein
MKSLLPLPDPTMIAGRRYWPKGQIRRWVAAIADKPEPNPQPDDETLVNARQLRDLFGGVSDMWIYRRQHPDHVPGKRRPANLSVPAATSSPSSAA